MTREVEKPHAEVHRTDEHDGSALARFSLRDKTVILTGASSGLGAQFARALGEAGASLMLAARRDDRLRALAGELSCAYQVCDVTSDADRAALVATVLRQFGRIDVLVNNAGIASTRPAQEETAAGFRKVLETN